MFNRAQYTGDTYRHQVHKRRPIN